MSSQELTKAATASKDTPTEASSTALTTKPSTVLVSHTRNGKPLYKSNVPAPLPQKILEEDDYTDALSKIIERDFFPDLARLRRQHAYLDAVQANDLERIAATARDLAGNDTPLAHQRFKTPGATPRVKSHGLPNEPWTPARVDANVDTTTWNGEAASTPRTETPSRTGTKQRRSKGTPPPEQETIDTNMSLDQFQAMYTSEDNASFNEILEKVNARKQEEYNWMHSLEQKSILLIEHQREGRELPDTSGTIEDKSKLQLMLADKRSGVIPTWGYKAKNTLMYQPDGLGSDLNDRIIRGNPKEISHANTAFQGTDLLVVNQAAAAKFDPTPFLKAGVTDSPKVNGYGFVSSTPTPCMSELGDDPDMMTWGTIEDEPLLISSGISASDAAPSPFRIPETPRRELIAQKLSDKASKSFRNNSTLRAQVFSTPSAGALELHDAVFGGSNATPKFNSPQGAVSSPSSNKPYARMSSPSPRVRAGMLSPAAQRLLGSRKSASGDKQLRSSYTSTPKQSLSTPLRHQAVHPSPLARKG
ncbi:protein DGCR14 [Entomortierella parvispora]|uniref:Protein DGCR14 n=1 Tax=Entomortierella parvispora TaxID=205924 RepID=A0A9P3HA85_9FUNG|nr:protein DGCR14 [Entomortierella parvispora]